MKLKSTLDIKKFTEKNLKMLNPSLANLKLAPQNYNKANKQIPEQLGRNDLSSLKTMHIKSKTLGGKIDYELLKSANKKKEIESFEAYMTMPSKNNIKLPSLNERRQNLVKIYMTRISRNTKINTIEYVL